MLTSTVSRPALALVLAAALSAGAGAQETPSVPWPDFRGPEWNGHAPSARVPLNWSEERNVRWKTPLTGEGWSTPAVAEGRAWLTTASESGERLSVVAVDVETGKVLVDRVLFEVEAPEKKNALNSYASPSPVAEPGRVYVHFGTYGTACLDGATGETLWERRDLPCDHMEGPGSSPVLFGTSLIFNVDGGDVQYVVALDKKTGRTRWKTERSIDFEKVPRDMRKAFSTPIVVRRGARDVLVSTGALGTMGYDCETGEELWRLDHPGFSMSSRPLFADGVLYVNTGFMRANLIAVAPEGEGTLTDEHVLWDYKRGVPTMPSPLLVDGRIFFVADKGGVVTCLDAATGEELWRERIDGEHCASPVYAAGRLYFFDREGNTVVLAAGDKFEELARNRLDEGFMASPVVVDDAFLLRTRTHLYRVEEPAEARK